MTLLTKTKIQPEAYSHKRLGYNMTCSTERPSSAMGNHSGVGLVTRDRPVWWGIESTHYHRPNMFSYKIVTGLTQTPLGGAYLPPSTLEHLPELEEALQRFKDPIVFGDLNMDLDKARTSRSQSVSDLLVEYGLIDLV